MSRRAQLPQSYIDIANFTSPLNSRSKVKKEKNDRIELTQEECTYTWPSVRRYESVWMNRQHHRFPSSVDYSVGATPRARELPTHHTSQWESSLTRSSEHASLSNRPDHEKNSVTQIEVSVCRNSNTAWVNNTICTGTTHVFEHNWMAIRHVLRLMYSWHMREAQPL